MVRLAIAGASTVVAVLALAVVVVVAPLAQDCRALPAGSGATVAHDPGVAAELLRVAVEAGASDRALLAAFQAGLVESGLRNLPFGDRDSAGVMQQRPSQGWGDYEQVTDVTYAASAFLLGSTAAGSAAGGGNPGALQIEDGGFTGSAGELAQAVQRSAHPDRYDQRTDDALAVIAAVAGGQVVSAAAGPLGPPSAKPIPAGVQPVTAYAAQALRRYGFDGPLGGLGYRPPGASQDHPDGYALDAMTGDHTGKPVGDAVAAFLVVNGEALNVAYVIWWGYIDTLDGRGWRPMVDRGGDTANHYDHVHVSFHRDGMGGAGAISSISGGGAPCEPFAPGDGTVVDGLALPVAAGWVDAQAARRPHHTYPAWDLALPTGTPIYSVTGGRVVSVSTGGGCGRGVFISDPAGGLHGYCHAAAVQIARGDTVGAGQQIMLSGDTGRSTGPHLHYQIRAGERLRCPQPLIAALRQHQPAPAIGDLPTQGCVR